MDFEFENANQLKQRQEANLKSIQSKIKSLKLISDRMLECEFIANQKVFLSESSGHLNVKCLSNYLAIYSNDKTIQMWDLNSNECIKKCTGHTGFVTSFESLSNNQFISGLNDKSIKIHLNYMI